jgi:hypothetical protein
MGIGDSTTPRPAYTEVTILRATVDLERVLPRATLTYRLSRVPDAAWLALFAAVYEDLAPTPAARPVVEGDRLVFARVSLFATRPIALVAIRAHLLLALGVANQEARAQDAAQEVHAVTRARRREARLARTPALLDRQFPHDGG